MTANLEKLAKLTQEYRQEGYIKVADEIGDIVNHVRNRNTKITSCIYGRRISEKTLINKLLGKSSA